MGRTGAREDAAALDVVAIETGLWQVRVPLHVRVDPANVWIGRDGDGALTIFDAGIGGTAIERWESVIRGIGHHAADVTRIIVSHHHPDHIGGTGVLHELTGAPILASESTILQAPDIWGDDGRIDSYFAEMADHYRRCGVPEPVAGDVAREIDGVRRLVQLAPAGAWSAIHQDDVIDVDGAPWRVHLAPGHADGMVVLHDPARRRLLGADHLLERISPAVGRFPRHDEDPLGRYVESLQRVAALEPDVVYPGHGAPFAGGAARAIALVEHHRQRVDECVESVRARAAGGDAASVYEVARDVFARVFARPDRSTTDVRFATTEALAHLVRAEAEGLLVAAPDDEGAEPGHATWRYRPA